MREWLYGRNPVYETLRAGRRRANRLWIAQGVEEKGNLAKAMQLARQQKIKIEFVPRPKLDEIAPNHQGVALETNEYPYTDLHDMLAAAQADEAPPFFLILDALQDPQNLGTLFRTAEAVGVHGVLLPYRQTATVTPAVVSASSGASEHLRIGQANLAQAIKELKEHDIWVYGLDGGPDAQPVDKVNLRGAIALVVGSEGQGMRRLVQESCDVVMRLPMQGQIESLNAAVAGSIALYLAWGARGYTQK